MASASRDVHVYAPAFVCVLAGDGQAELILVAASALILSETLALYKSFTYLLSVLTEMIHPSADGRPSNN